jgi:hypothetical protein
LLQNVQRAAEAAVVMLCHTFLGGVTVTCMWGIKQLIEYFGSGTSVLIYDRWPIECFFQTVDIAIAVVISIFGLWETAEVLKRR